MIVGVHAFVVAASRPEDLRGAIGQHLVGVHVVRGAGAGLVHVDDELIAKPAGQHLVGRGDDRARDVRIEAPERAVGFGRRLLDLDGGVTSSGGAVMPLIGKFSTARWVCTP